MQESQDAFEASLLYEAPRDLFDSVDALALSALLERLGTPVDHVERKPDEFVHLSCAALQILVVLCQVPFPSKHFAGAVRPENAVEDDVLVLSRLAQHDHSLTVLVSDRDDQDGPSMMPASDRAALKLKLCWEIVDLLLATTDATLVYWGAEDTILTPVEAELAIAELDGGLTDDAASEPDVLAEADVSHAAPVRPRRPTNGSRRAARPDRSATDPSYHRFAEDFHSGAAAPFIHVPFNQHAVVPRRPSRSAEARQCSRRRGAADSGSASQIRIDPEQLAVYQSLRCGSLAEEMAEVMELSASPSGRASLYVMSATLMVFSLPIGATMLTYNALSGGSFRATAHAMALTGLALAIGTTGLSIPGIGLV